MASGSSCTWCCVVVHRQHFLHFFYCRVEIEVWPAHVGSMPKAANTLLFTACLAFQRLVQHRRAVLALGYERCVAGGSIACDKRRQSL